MASATAKCIHISPLGLSDLQNQVLKVAVNLLAQDGIEYRLLNANNPAGQLLVVDNDTDSGRYVLTHARKTQIKLAFSSQSQSGKNLVTLKKPIRVSVLKDLLGAIHRKFNRPKIHVLPTPTPEPVAEVAPPLVIGKVAAKVADKVAAKKIEPTLLDALLEAKQHHQSLNIQHKNLGDIFINTSEQTYAGSNKVVYIDQLAAIPFSEMQIKIINSQTFNRYVKQLEIHALNGLLWRIGIHCSGGVLIGGHGVDTPIRLKGWPNFTRNSFNPKHLKIAAAMARQPTTLMQLKDTVELPLTDVVNFYNASLMIDLIDKNPADFSIDPLTEKAEVNRGLLKKLAERLGFG